MDSESLDTSKRKTDDNENDSSSGTLADRPLRRRYGDESPSEQRKKQTQELAELRQQSEALRQEGGLNPEDKQRQLGMIYSRRKRLRAKQKELELEEEIERVRASNQQLKVDNSRLEAIYSVVMAQLSQQTQLSHTTAPLLPSQSAFAHVHAGQPQWPSHQRLPFGLPTSSLELPGAYLHPPLPHLGDTGHSLVPSMYHYHRHVEMSGTPATMPSLQGAIANQAISDWQKAAVSQNLQYAEMDAIPRVSTMPSLHDTSDNQTISNWQRAPALQTQHLFGLETMPRASTMPSLHAPFTNHAPSSMQRGVASQHNEGWDDITRQQPTIPSHEVSMGRDQPQSASTQFSFAHTPNHMRFGQQHTPSFQAFNASGHLAQHLGNDALAEQGHAHTMTDPQHLHNTNMPPAAHPWPFIDPSLDTNMLRIQPMTLSEGGNQQYATSAVARAATQFHPPLDQQFFLRQHGQTSQPASEIAGDDAVVDEYQPNQLNYP
ncbi:hypothetical protein MPSEU_001031100 [Mayamaea pseudoterrestris]|nr:hypothetical protein MPSEU_001031100 [Mayamaea pseudoterrestris]